MGIQLWKDFEVQYGDLHRMIHAVAVQVASRAGDEALTEELCAQGWLIAWANLQKYDAARGAKMTTFVWPHLRGRLYRHFRETCRQVFHMGTTQRQLSTEECWSEEVLALNPYVMAPDRVLEGMETRALWAKMAQDHGAALASYYEAEGSCEGARARRSRRRRRAVSDIQASLAGIHRLPDPKPAVRPSRRTDRRVHAMHCFP
ncbi:MAG: hypothetical protein FWC40_01215 [Proteobacteria bacterium]|nr:hypothetical protein [Pseudomonadota bacterium]